MPEKKNDASGKKQDPRVEQLRPDPSQPPPRARSLAGLWGDSDRPDFRRLYLTRDLDVYAEFRVEDVLATLDIPPERAPFLGEQATRVELRHDAPVDITHSRRAGDVDEFDLDVRFGTGGPRPVADVFASSGARLCVKPGEHITDPCDYTCGWICKTYKDAEGHRHGCPGGGKITADCATDTCNTCEGATNCGTCYTDLGYTQCGTCYTDFGYTACGGCKPVRRP
jgi:hypothetical protein